MDATSQKSRNGNVIALVLLTRNIGGYRSVADMADASRAVKQWGKSI